MTNEKPYWANLVYNFDAEKFGEGKEPEPGARERYQARIDAAAARANSTPLDQPLSVTPGPDREGREENAG